MKEMMISSLLSCLLSSTKTGGQIWPDQINQLVMPSSIANIHCFVLFCKHNTWSRYVVPVALVRWIGSMSWLFYCMIVCWVSAASSPFVGAGWGLT